MRLSRNACLLFALAIAPNLAGSFAVAQVGLTDHETAAKAAQLQQAAEWRLAFRPSLSVLRQTVSQLRTFHASRPASGTRLMNSSNKHPSNRNQTRAEH